MRHLHIQIDRSLRAVIKYFIGIISFICTARRELKCMRLKNSKSAIKSNCYLEVSVALNRIPRTVTRLYRIVTIDIAQQNCTMHAASVTRIYHHVSDTLPKS